MTIDVQPKFRIKFHEYYEARKSYRIKWIKRIKQIKILPEVSIDLKEYLYELYWNQEYGYKMLARGFETTYSIMRRMFKYLNIPVRIGYRIVTNRVREFKSYRVQGNRSPWFDWPNRFKNPEKNSRGISGYYKKLNGELVWLRSSWEYIFAKWLDKQNVVWTIETKCYLLSNGERYRPDFFIYDEGGSLKLIIEIKGWYTNRLNKIDLFKKEYNIPIIVVDNINDYTLKYGRDLKEWKNIRLLNKK